MVDGVRFHTKWHLADKLRAAPSPSFHGHVPILGIRQDL